MTVAENVRHQTRDTAMWYGGLALLLARALRNLALPSSYLRIVAREIDTIGVRTDINTLTV